MQIASPALEFTSSSTQGFPHTSMWLFEFAKRVAAKPFAVTVYAQPPWNEQLSPLVLSVTVKVFVIVMSV